MTVVAKTNSSSLAGDPEHEYLRIPEAADILRISNASIRRYLTQQLLTRYKIAGQAKGPTLLRRDEVLALVQKG